MGDSCVHYSITTLLETIRSGLSYGELAWQPHRTPSWPAAGPQQQSSYRSCFFGQLTMRRPLWLVHYAPLSHLIPCHSTGRLRNALSPASRHTEPLDLEHYHSGVQSGLCALAAVACCTLSDDHRTAVTPLLRSPLGCCDWYIGQGVPTQHTCVRHC